MNESQYEAYWRKQNEKVTQQWITTNIQICPQMQYEQQSIHNDYMQPTHTPNKSVYNGDEKQRKIRKIADILSNKRSPPNYCSSSSTSFSTHELMKSFDKFQIALDSPSPPQSIEFITKPRHIFRKAQPPTPPPKKQTQRAMVSLKTRGAMRIQTCNYLRIIPDQTDKAYLSMIFPVEWFHPKLVPELLHHFTKHLTTKVSDLYVERVDRFGFFTIKDHSLASKFLQKCKKGMVKCMGRNIDARIVEQRDAKLKNWTRIRVKTINFTMGSIQFEKWVYWALGCQKKKKMINNIQVLIPNKSIHRTRKTREKPLQMMVVFETKKQAMEAALKLETVLFKGYPMNFEYWEHPQRDPRGGKRKFKEEKKPIFQKGWGGNLYCDGELIL